MNEIIGEALAHRRFQQYGDLAAVEFLRDAVRWFNSRVETRNERPQTAASITDLLEAYAYFVRENF